MKMQIENNDLDENFEIDSELLEAQETKQLVSHKKNVHRFRCMFNRNLCPPMEST